MSQTIEDLLQEALDTWGEDAQIMMALEECGELITALTQYWRGRKTKEEVAEEIADVSIMMRQMRLVFGYETVNEIEAGKLVRLKKRIEESKVELCESCGENPGQLNSMFWWDEDETEGHWVCKQCEQELAEQHEEWARSMASVYAGAYEGRVCRCHHAERFHDNEAGRCEVPGCGCETFTDQAG